MPVSIVSVDQDMYEATSWLTWLVAMGSFNTTSSGRNSFAASFSVFPSERRSRLLQCLRTPRNLLGSGYVSRGEMVAGS